MKSDLKEKNYQNSTFLETTKYQGIYLLNIRNRKKIVTKNLTHGKIFFNENKYLVDNIEYREFNPGHSKLAAAIAKRISLIPIKEKDKILYLGASHGYTPSFISDMIGENGMIFCLDFAPRVVRDLLFVCEERINMSPILANAKKPDTYKNRISKVDVIYQDVAQKDQVEILLKNLDLLNPKGYVLIAIKSRSIDVTKNPRIIYKEVEEKLKTKLRIMDKKELDPYQKDHIFFVCQKK
ncbi:MAG TPA: fibrillarin-like rRNA/tRNA 2'-O-methyltransferase [Candidatus Nanoarchaeia archaeon]|nr:fibrillarin-like rRNA/tRNA 2'-O-methyltransferase [Candidatus Nanoarchaeia archaeon]